MSEAIDVERVGASSALIVPAEIFFARRASWVFHRVFSETDVRIKVPAFESIILVPAGGKRSGAWLSFETRS
jgi:hypothetical protein